MTNAEYLARFLEERGITHVFHLIGGMTALLVDAIRRTTKIRLVTMHHEQAAAFAAEGWARMTGKPGVAMATSGPGAVNLLTGIASCYFDSTPAVFITGQVPGEQLKSERQVRQQGFQETDIASLAHPITKYSHQWKGIDLLPAQLCASFSWAKAGRPGPVLIDLPMDLQQQEAGKDHVYEEARRDSIDSAERSAFIKRMVEAHAYSKRTLILAGGGVRSAGALEAFQAFARHLRVPVVHSLMGVDLMPYNWEARIGLIGSYGNRWANLALARADNLIVLGSRLDVRQTGADLAGFAKGKRIYHIDCDAAELGNRLPDTETWREELRPFLEACLREIPARVVGPRTDWWQEIDLLRKTHPDSAELAGVRGINPNDFMAQLSLYASSAAAFVVDVGQHQMWAAQSLRLDLGQRFLTSGGMGAMGWALPAAIGAAFAAQGQPIIVIAGDGGFQCNLQELQTVARNRLPLKLVVLNNRSLGMVRQFQDELCAGRHEGTVDDYSAPDFVGVAGAYGIPGEVIEKPEAIRPALMRLMAERKNAYLLEVMIDPAANAYPKMAYGKPFGEMEP
jgi:acetolactate synthase-1/2/3 large subunit